MGRNRSNILSVARCGVMFVLITGTAHADPTTAFESPKALPRDVTRLSLEELMDIEITSVAKKSQSLSDAAAAVFVVTGEDLRRSGVTSIPEALRMVPGIQVARLSANQWAITARGFNSRFANKLLVLIDGRTVYNHAFSGVFWEALDVVLEDVERIEVIRGPGGTLWGENAVNGVINIITKHAKDTQGGLVTTGVGTEERGFGTLRYGGTIGETLQYRVYGKYFNRDTGFNQEGARDDWRMGRGGFRTDWAMGGQDSLTIQGDYYAGDAGQQITTATLTPPNFTETVAEDARLSGGNIQARWDHTFYAESDMALLLYYDRWEREESGLQGKADLFTLDVQHRFPLPLRQEILWGLEYRFVSDTLRSSRVGRLEPKDRTLNFFSAFVQDEFRLIEDKLHLTVGSKLSRNDFTGFEIQPSARLRWTPTPQQTVWTAVSRAVRTPTRIEDDFRFRAQGTPVGFVTVRGNRDLEAEDLLAIELGYRNRPLEWLSFDIATFYNRYDGIVFAAPGSSPLELTLVNAADAETYGAELATDWQMRNWWRIRAAATYLQMRLHGVPSMIGAGTDGDNPDQAFSLHSFMNLSETLEVNTALRFVDALPDRNVPSYLTLDLGVTWKPYQGMELSLIGQNLLDNHHPEFTPTILNTQATEVQRSIYVLTRWRF